MSDDGTTQVAAQPVLVELDDPGPREAWRRYHDSGLIDIIGKGYLLLVLDACAQVGLLQRLAAGMRSPDDLLEGLDREIGLNILRFLEIHEVLDSAGGRYRLTKRGQDLTSDISMAMLGFYGRAYLPVVSQTAPLLTGAMVYGRDIERDVAALSRHSGVMFHTFHTPTMLRALADANVNRLLDLGCGAGRLLIDACRQNERLTGIGLDISEDAVAVAKEQAEAAGLAHRIEFIVCDAFAPDQWPARCLEMEAMSAVGVLHEFFRDGEEGVVELCDRFAEMLRGGMKMFVLGEPELHYDNRENDSEFFLAHILTAQGFPRHRGQWLDFFERTSLRCRRMFTRPSAGQRLVFYDLVLR